MHEPLIDALTRFIARPGSVLLSEELAASGDIQPGDTLTLRDRIEHHHTTGLSTVEATALNRAEVVREFARYFSEAPPAREAYEVSALPRNARLEISCVAVK